LIIIPLALLGLRMASGNGRLVPRTVPRKASNVVFEYGVAEAKVGGRKGGGVDLACCWEHCGASPALPPRRRRVVAPTWRIGTWRPVAWAAIRRRRSTLCSTATGAPSRPSETAQTGWGGGKGLRTVVALSLASTRRL
jgi:hypothetical protein